MTASTAQQTLKFKPGEIEVSNDVPFANDKLNREEFVKATSSLLKAIQEPFVVALNAPWGSGKSTAIRFLERQLKLENVISVSFNAWEVDYSSDPLVPLVALLHDRILEIKGFPEALESSKIERFKKLGGALAKHGAIAAVKAATAGVVDAGAVAEGISKAIDKATEDFTGDVIDAFKKEKDFAEEFRKLLGEITAYVRETTKEGDIPAPVVLLIDELDRCRPSFAVAMLERIKHFFNIPGLVFVLALDLQQLMASTKKIYGAEMDAIEYLRRFIDLELQLPRADVKAMIENALSGCGADAYFDQRGESRATRGDRDWLVNMLHALASYFKLPPRVVQRMISRLILVLRQTPQDRYLDPILVVFMVFLRMRHDGIYRNIVLEQAGAREIMLSLEQSTVEGAKFAKSHFGKIIEAHLLHAQNRGEAHERNKEFLSHAKMLDQDSLAPEDLKIREICGYYERVRSEYFSRNSINLAVLDQRINLVASDLKDEQM